MPEQSVQELARRLALVLPRPEGRSFEALQARLAKTLARLWDIYAELLEVRGALASGTREQRPVRFEEFRPGDTLTLGASLARTDPRVVLADRMNIPAWADLLGELAGAVLNAPDLARQELLTVLADLEENVLREIAGRFADEEDSDEFPAQPSGEGS